MQGLGSTCFWLFWPRVENLFRFVGEAIAEELVFNISLADILNFWFPRVTIQQRTRRTMLERTKTERVATRTDNAGTHKR